MQFRIDKHGQLVAEIKEGDESALGLPQNGSKTTFTREETEKLAMMLLPIAKNFLEEYGVSNNL